jgi:hypothetical protein
VRPLAIPLLVPVAIFVAGCGSSGKSGAPQPRTAEPAPPAQARQAPATTVKAPSASAPSALQAEANSASAGDIPDNQVFIVFHDAKAGYSIKYPEGWAQQGSGASVTFRDKNNIVRIVLVPEQSPTASSIRRQLGALHGVRVQSAPRTLTIAGASAFEVVYATKSAPSTVTGKRVTLVVDRFYLSRAGKTAIVDLGTPQGVDNVDAYRLMIESFRWR